MGFARESQLKSDPAVYDAISKLKPDQFTDVLPVYDAGARAQGRRLRHLQADCARTRRAAGVERSPRAAGHSPVAARKQQATAAKRLSRDAAGRGAGAQLSRRADSEARRAVGPHLQPPGLTRGAHHKTSGHQTCFPYPLSQQLLRPNQAIPYLNPIRTLHRARGTVPATYIADFLIQIPEVHCRLMVVASKIVIRQEAQLIRNRQSLRALAAALDNTCGNRAAGSARSARKSSFRLPEYTVPTSPGSSFRARKSSA